MKNFFVILLVLSVVLALSGCIIEVVDNGKQDDINNGKHDDVNTGAAASVENNNSTPDQTDVSSKIDIRSIPTIDNECICVFITNNSDVVIDELDVQTNFKDSNGVTIDLDTDGHDMILPGYTVVSRMECPNEYASFETTHSIELGVNPRYKNHSENCSVETNIGNDCVIINLTNNGEVLIEEVEYNVIFYKGENIVEVCFSEDIRDLGVGETRTLKQDAPYGVEFDRAEIYLNQAHTFG